jgi:hypothetical protein
MISQFEENSSQVKFRETRIFAPAGRAIYGIKQKKVTEPND